MSTIRHTYVSVLGYGDALISLQLLQQTAASAVPLLIAGTSVTQEIQSKIVGTDIAVARVLPGHAAFFRIRYAGLRQSLQEILAFRAWAEATLTADDIVLFEKPDVRNRLILGRCRARRVEPQVTDSSYLDRKRMIEQVTGCELALPDCAQPAQAPRSVLINPSAAALHREIALPVMHNLITLFRQHGLRISITDPDGKFLGNRELFDEYHGRLDLTAAAALVRNHDVYVGPDSFFIHLAYYLRVPFIALVPTVDFNFYFAPPASKRLRNFVAMPDTHHPDKLSRAVGAFLGW